MYNHQIHFIIYNKLLLFQDQKYWRNVLWKIIRLVSCLGGNGLIVLCLFRFIWMGRPRLWREVSFWFKLLNKIDNCLKMIQFLSISKRNLWHFIILKILLPMVPWLLMSTTKTKIVWTSMSEKVHKELLHNITKNMPKLQTM